MLTSKTLSTLIAWALLTVAWKYPSLPGRMVDKPVSYITFVAQPADNWDLFVMSESGEDVRQLSRTPIDERAPALSPDRKTIVYSNSNGELWTVELVSGRHEKIELPKGTYNFPCWSPDGEEILFVQKCINGPTKRALSWATLPVTIRYEPSRRRT
jgi:hypothetical protein